MLVFCSSVSGRSSTPTSRSFWRKRSIASSNAVLGVSPDIPSNSVALGANVKLGVFLPISGRAASAVLTDAARRAEALGGSEEHTSELQSRLHLVCRLLLEKKKKTNKETAKKALKWHMTTETTLMD